MTSDAIPTAVDSAGAPIRVLIAKAGLDGHDRGAKVVARALRDAGMEVTYTGIRQTPAMIAEIAQREGVQVVGLSSLSGAHLELFPRVVDALHERGIDDVILLAGGIIPAEDLPALRELGFEAVFGPGTDTSEIVTFVRHRVPRSEGGKALPRGESAAGGPGHG